MTPQTESESESVPGDWSALPRDLPVPTDDGLADHLSASASASSQVVLPTGVLLRATATFASPGEGQGSGETVVDLRALSFEGPVLVFVYPRTGQPGVANAPGWDAIPGARGCTPELCAIRDTLGALRTARAGGVRIFALSTQSAAYQTEVATRLGLPYPILSDEAGAFSRALRLPTFEVEGIVLLKRITLLLYEGKVIGRDYPVFPSDQAARRALELLVSILARFRRQNVYSGSFSKHILNAQVSIRAPCCKQWFDCAACHAETQDHQLAKTAEMAFVCKKCKKAFRKDMSHYEESDEYCPHCDNHYVLEAKTPQAVLGVEGEDARVDARMLKDERVRQDPNRTLFRRDDLSDVLG